MELADVIRESHELIGLGEPSHGDTALADARFELLTRLVDGGVRSIAFESDRVAGLAADDYVQGRAGSLDTAMAEGFTHGFGAFDVNRRLVAWMREYNEQRPPAERLSFHGMDAPLEFTAASPRGHLEHVRDYLGLDLDLAPLAGDDQQWSRMEAVTDPAASPGDTPEAHRLRAVADDLLTALYSRAPHLIAATSRAAWDRARIHAATAVDLLRYHRQAAERIDEAERWSRLSAVRDAIMARNLLDIRDREAGRGPTAVLAHNIHLQRNESRMEMAGMTLTWFGTGAVVAALLGPKYGFIAGSLGFAGGEDFGGADAVLVADGDKTALAPAPDDEPDRD
ncbi:erythromycin esterase family protein [Glycomyces albidus]|uniref:Erythromycin esterase family protein n=1 Tax=Glycomyces albidus TaxID=2656774 RepID=A0A6L5GE78_9ACTN|nr:erythromycin esterase family protein [Glycomyces albidus]MQM28000.1 erythromycin esterase family protein [Glycomyces albidus]